MNAKFYIMPDSVSADSEAFQQAVCELVANHYRNGERIYVYCPTQAYAEQLDELLWQFRPEQFVPHNLSGEGPKGGAPVELGWQAPRQRRNTLVNLSQQVPDFAANYQFIIDFVPGDEANKNQARDRYRMYRQHGLQLSTETYTQQESN